MAEAWELNICLAGRCNYAIASIDKAAFPGSVSRSPNTCMPQTGQQVFFTTDLCLSTLIEDSSAKNEH